MDYPSTLPAALRRTLADLYRADETALAETLLTAAQLTPSQLEHAERDAQRWIETIRNTKKSLLGVAEMLSIPAKARL